MGLCKKELGHALGGGSLLPPRLPRSPGGWLPPLDSRRPQLPPPSADAPESSCLN